MFRRLPDKSGAATLTVTIDGERHAARTGDTVAAVLLLSSAKATRVSPVSGEPRAPYCMMGVCFECLVTIDGVGNRQGCLIEVADGMRIETQMTRREAGK
jgi:D-hydroxyproline dehydrogenase subunit gamma